MNTRALAWSFSIALGLTLAACAGTRSGDVREHPARCGHTTPASDTPTPVAVERPSWKHEESLERGVRFLLTSQNANGSWGHHLPWRPGDIYIGGFNTWHGFCNASSALCCMALLAQPESTAINAALTRGYRYLVDAPDAVRVNAGTFYDVWSHAYMCAALARGLGDKRLASLHDGLRERIKLELRRIYQLQGLDGGWGYYDFKHGTYRPSGDLSTSFTSAAVLVALKELEQAGIEVEARKVKLGLDYLERMRVPNGAYLYSSGHKYGPLYDPNMIRGSLGRSQSGDNALATWQRTLKPTDVQAGMDRFFKDHVFIEIGRGRQWPHEAWYATAPYYYYFGHYYASRNLSLLPVDARQPYSARLADLIAKTQYDDGSFWDYPLFGYTKAYGTGFGVLIMTYCKNQFE